ncbi:MAG: hypothetical protein BJ554DRAFT_6009 [Olpidium bornovanus]|uniref:Uncharacterized protein n=1 Tax=Olpidium bornovanus TaxID=278681 RepID=A0A8H7ZYL3_9FUNG|nr:MAG: hypothetical protein BJ554DRAFT_6009 [Olpidium bornovanus]
MVDPAVDFDHVLRDLTHRKTGGAPLAELFLGGAKRAACPPAPEFLGRAKRAACPPAPEFLGRAKRAACPPVPEFLGRATRAACPPAPEFLDARRAGTRVTDRLEFLAHRSQAGRVLFVSPCFPDVMRRPSSRAVFSLLSLNYQADVLHDIILAVKQAINHYEADLSTAALDVLGPLMVEVQRKAPDMLNTHVIPQLHRTVIDRLTDPYQSLEAARDVLVKFWSVAFSLGEHDATVSTSAALLASLENDFKTAALGHQSWVVREKVGNDNGKLRSGWQFARIMHAKILTLFCCIVQVKEIS